MKFGRVAIAGGDAGLIDDELGGSASSAALTAMRPAKPTLCDAERR